MIECRTDKGDILKPGDMVRLGKNGTTKIKGWDIGTIIHRRNKSTGFTTHRAGPLGHLWVKFGKIKDNTQKIVALSPRLMEFVGRMAKKKFRLNKAKVIDNLDIASLALELDLS